MALTRRGFLKLSGSTGMALALAAGLEQESAEAAGNAAESNEAPEFGALIDISRCIGCRRCEGACKSANNLPAETEPPDDRKLSATRFTFVAKKKTPSPASEQILTRFVKKQCMHCLEPACASACPVGALHKSETGAVVYDEGKCIGCRYCMVACPFDVPRYQWESAAPLIRKCQLCEARISAGQATACSVACPAGTVTFGPRNELLAEAAARIKANPEKYVDYIYGKDEVGGTSILYLSNLPFEELGFRMDLPKDSLPERTHAVMSKLPALVLGMAVVLGAGTVLNGRNNGHDLPPNSNGGTGSGTSTGGHS